MQKIRIDFDNPGLPQHISAVENDSQSRFFQATLYENGKAYTAPEGAAYSIMYRGFGPQNQGWYDTINDGAGKRAACTVSGNVVTCEIARQALQVPGHVSIVLCVTTGKGYMLKSWPIECDCKNDRYDSTVEIQSFFYVTQISNESWTQAIQAVEELKNTIDPTLSVSGKAADAAKVGEVVNAEAERAKGVESQIKEDLGKQEKEINSVKDLFFDVDQKTYYDHASNDALSQSSGKSGRIYVLNDFFETNGKLTEVEISVASDCNFKLYVFEQYDTTHVSKVKLSNIFDFDLKKGNNRISVNAIIPKKVRFGITGENNSIKYGNIGNGSIHWTTTSVSNWNTIGQTGVINTGGNTGDFSISLFSTKQTQLIKNLKGKTILLFGDSRSSSDYTWYKDLLEEKTGAIVLNNGSSGANPKSMITTGYLDNMLEIKHDICIMFLCGNISGYKESIGTFSYGSPLNVWGENVVSRWNGEEEFDVNTFNKPIQHIDYIVQKYNKKFFADRKHKLYILTDIPSKRSSEQHGYTVVCNYGKSEMIKEVCSQNSVPYIDTMTKCRFNEDFEPSYTPPTDLTTNNGVYYMDGLHLNEYGNDVLTDVIVHELLDV